MTLIKNSRQGQGSILGVIILAIVSAALGWMAMDHLKNREADAHGYLRVLGIDALKLNLFQVFQSAEFLKGPFLALNPEFIDYLPPTFKEGCQSIREIAIPTPTGELWLGGGAEHLDPSFENCIDSKDPSQQQCPFTSVVHLVGCPSPQTSTVSILISFKQNENYKKFPFNPELKSHQIEIRLPLNLFAIKIVSNQISCEKGYHSNEANLLNKNFVCVRDP